MREIGRLLETCLIGILEPHWRHWTYVGIFKLSFPPFQGSSTLCVCVERQRVLVHQILKPQSVDDTSYQAKWGGSSPIITTRFICQLCQDVVVVYTVSHLSFLQQGNFVIYWGGNRGLLLCTKQGYLEDNLTKLVKFYFPNWSVSLQCPQLVWSVKYIPGSCHNVEY